MLHGQSKFLRTIVDPKYEAAYKKKGAELYSFRKSEGKKPQDERNRVVKPPLILATM